ncbi:hypothetical protein EJB05_22478, partial [Eragrostis curvula]
MCSWSRTRPKATSTRCSSSGHPGRDPLRPRLTSHRGVRCTLAVTRHALGSCGPARSTSPASPTAATAADSTRWATSGVTWNGSSPPGPCRSASSSRASRRGARLHGTRCAAFFTQACAVNVVFAHAWAGRLRLPVVDASPPDELPGLPAGLAPDDLPTEVIDRVWILVYRDLLLRQCEGLGVADHVLVNSFYELQTKEAEYMATRWVAKTVGPSVPSAYLDNRLPDDTSYGFHLHAPMTAEAMAWLDKRPAHSVVYVSFGSLVALDPDQMAEVAKGLYNSGKAFLWVVRASETSKLPKGFADKAEQRGLIMSWCPRLDVLAHPAIGCFLTHCGWNSTMEGLGAGVPMVAMPQWADQPMNAKYIDDVWRVGVRVRSDPQGMVCRQEMARCVKEVMEGEMSKQYRDNARSWSIKAKKAMSEGGTSDNNMVEFLAQLRPNCLGP